MKRFTPMLTVFALLTSVAFVVAEDVKSGLQEGEGIGAFYVTKLCGADEDGVAVGKNLCYRCKNGGRPQVMIFTRSADQKVADLVREIDEAIPKNDDKQLRAFVNAMGENQAAAKSNAEKLAKASEAKNVPFVLPNEFENGPADYGINPSAEVTVIMAQGGKVKANHSAKSAADLKVDAIVADLRKILN